jgi:hypothetical protein
MGRNTRLSPYAKGNGEEFDEEASVIEFMSYRSAPSASKGNLPPDDSVPLFLSDHDEQPPRRPSFGRVRSEDSDSERILREPVSPRIIKASILAASVTAIIVAIFAVGNPLALFANAKASLAGTAAGLSGAQNQVAAIQRVPEPVRAAPEPVVAVRTASADPTAQEAQPNLGARAVSPTARSGPTRDEIASAFKTARQGQPEAALPPAAVPVVTVPVAAAPAAAVPAAAPPAARRIDPEELATLLKRARSLISIGDFAPARLLLKRAADAQEASAALLLAQTYDPAVLGKQDMRSIAPDPALAREWYQKAARYGSVDAQQRLSQMQN